MNAVSQALPGSLWQSPAALKLMGKAAGSILGAGRISLVGQVPNGQRFIANPRHLWIIATSQQDLEKVVDRTNFQPALVGRLNARFELKPHLISDEINKVVSERILKKLQA